MVNKRTPIQRKNWQQEKIQQSRQHQEVAFETINELLIVGREGKQIIFEDGSKLLEFISCSYLGLDQDERLIEASNNSLKTIGIAFHSARTRVLPKSYQILEKHLNDVFLTMHPIIFSSLHMAFQGLIPLIGSGELPHFSLKENGITFILDKSVHASVQINRALMQQFGGVELIEFENRQEIEKKFQEAQLNKKTPVAIADSVGSMGGIAPVSFLTALTEKYDGYLCLDDAHGTSVHGSNGSGYVLKCLNNEIHPRVIVAATLGKGFGTLGGVLLFKHQESAHFLKKYSSTYVFAGPPALSIIDAAIASAKIHLSAEIYQLQEKLWGNIQLFDSYNIPNTVNINILSPIRGIRIGDELTAINIARALRKSGIAVTTAMYPTVPKNASMLRLAFLATHTYCRACGKTS